MQNYCGNVESIFFEYNISAAPIGSWDVFDVALPGTLPLLNKFAVIQSIRAARALSCEKIHNGFIFDRKHYFYRDIPAGYQLTQKFSPLARDGKLRLEEGNKIVGIQQVQLEQDTMQTLRIPGFPGYCTDAFRANVPLIEVVTEPVIETTEQAIKVIKKLEAIMRTIGVSEASMDQVSQRLY